MKPNDALILSTQADLSTASYEDAVLMAKESFDKLEFYYEIELRVGFWESKEALFIMAKYQDCNVAILKHYNIDEWSIKVSTREKKSVEVWGCD